MAKKANKQKPEKNNSKNIKKIIRRRTYGQKLADSVTFHAGSWHFIILFMLGFLAWILLNALLLRQKPWDPYPFILLNLALSLLAAIQAPVILMSQNRSTERDRKKAETDLAIDRKAEREINQIQEELKTIKKMIKDNHNVLTKK